VKRMCVTNEYITFKYFQQYNYSQLFTSLIQQVYHSNARCISRSWSC